MKKYFYHFIVAVSTVSCRNVKAPEGALHTIAYEMEVTPADRYQGYITYLNEKGKLDSTVTAGPWRYEFKAKAGTLLRVNVVAKPNNAQETVRGMVRLKLLVNGNIVDSSVGSSMKIEHQVE